MIPFNRERIRDNVRQATTEDLLDRITVYRAGMEPEAVEIIEDELRRRDVNTDAVKAHASQRQSRSQMLPNGTAARCSFCDRPAVEQRWGWHWFSLWGKSRPLLPLFPRYFSYCEEHRPGAAG